MGSRIIHPWRMVLLAVLTVALVATGWAHRAVVPTSDQLAFMAATGATAADVCGDVGQGDRHADPLCQACQISGGAVLPDPVVASAFLDLTPAPGLAPLSSSRFVARVLDLSRAPQGPPTV